MRFDAALAAQDTLRDAEAGFGADWEEAVELEGTFSSNAGATAREAYEALLALADRHPDAHRFQAFCIYITWQQVTEETIAHHFQTGLTRPRPISQHPKARILSTSPTLPNCAIRFARVWA